MVRNQGLFFYRKNFGISWEMFWVRKEKKNNAKCRINMVTVILMYCIALSKNCMQVKHLI